MEKSVKPTKKVTSNNNTNNNKVFLYVFSENLQRNLLNTEKRTLRANQKTVSINNQNEGKISNSWDKR